MQCKQRLSVGLLWKRRVFIAFCTCAFWELLLWRSFRKTYTCPSSWAMVKEALRPFSSLMEQLRYGSHMVPSSAKPSGLHTQKKKIWNYPLLFHSNDRCAAWMRLQALNTCWGPAQVTGSVLTSRTHSWPTAGPVRHADDSQMKLSWQTSCRVCFCFRNQISLQEPD